MVELGLLIGLTILGVSYLLHLRWFHKPKAQHLDGANVTVHNDGSGQTSGVTQYDGSPSGESMAP